MMMIRIFLAGIGMLVGALLVNGLAKVLKLPTWYDFLADRQAAPHELIWLFLVYPLLLGFLVLVLKRIF